MPSVVQQNLYKYKKKTEKHCSRIYYEQKSRATWSLNAQLFFIMQHTKRSIQRSFKKDPTYWDYYIMTISLTCIIAHLIN